MSLGDLDELVLRCRTEEGRKYITEAVTCYKAGAYRACIVATWVAVVYDLISSTSVWFQQQLSLPRSTGRNSRKRSKRSQRY